MDAFGCDLYKNLFEISTLFDGMKLNTTSTCFSLFSPALHIFPHYIFCEVFLEQTVWYSEKPIIKDSFTFYFMTVLFFLTKL